ncbi:MAG: protein kinase [Acidobacteriota bacterium]
MPLSAGARLGPYEILDLLGAGGMGEVYRAKDARLGREVAIKVLPASFSADADRLRRFEQEARAAGILNHPNITAVHDIGSDASGAPYVVTELLEGETLRSRLSGGALSPRRALELALQITHGLAAAHEKGIVHRDLKPENLFVTKDGRIKILDFGLAKLTHTGEKGSITHMPTATAGTEPGVVLGTLGYMSPEQVRGRPADARSDIFSFGAILYEMLSGKRAFHGDSAADTMSAILREDPPDLSATNRNVSPGLERIVRHCLEKNPEQRFHSAHDLAFDLESVSGASAPAVAGRARARPSAGIRRALASLGIFLAGAVAGLIGSRAFAPPPPEPPRVRALTYSGKDHDPAVSPDGTNMAFVSRRDGRSRIWLKQIAGGGEAALSEGPEDAEPRFSPDGSSVLFSRWSGNEAAIFRVPVVGGDPRKVVSEGHHGAWSPDGSKIVFLRTHSRAGGFEDASVHIANADGSSERTIGAFPDTFLRRPRWTPDGSSIVVVESQIQITGPGSILLLSADGTSRRAIHPPESLGYLSSIAFSGDRLVYLQSDVPTGDVRTSAGRVLLQPQKGGRAEVVLHVPYAGLNLDVAGPGRLVFESDSSREGLREVSIAAGSGTPRWLTQGNGTDRQPAYSSDGEWIVFSSDRTGDFELWKISTKTGTLRRLTEHPGEDWDPSLSPDGRHLLWSSNRTGHFEVWIADADGSGARMLTRDGVDAENPTETRDGKWIVYTSGNPKGYGIWRIRPDGSGVKQVAAGGTVHPEVSPDGQYVLFHYPGVSARIARIEDGFILPLVIPLRSAVYPLGRSRWMPDGRGIATIGTDAEGRSGVFVQDFSTELADTSATRRPVAGFDPDRPTESFGISPDGKRIVLAENEGRSDILLAEGVRGIVAASRRTEVK